MHITGPQNCVVIPDRQMAPGGPSTIILRIPPPQRVPFEPLSPPKITVSLSLKTDPVVLASNSYTIRAFSIIKPHRFDLADSTITITKDSNDSAFSIILNGEPVASIDASATYITISLQYRYLTISFNTVTTIEDPGFDDVYVEEAAIFTGHTSTVHHVVASPTPCITSITYKSTYNDAALDFADD